MRLCKRLIGMLLTVVMLFSMVPAAFADASGNYPDLPTGWSKEAMTAAVANGLLNGFEDGTIRPEANLTRAEFAAIITRAFGAKTKADISAYTDVISSEWYYDAIAKAVKMGALNGKSESKMDPDAPITRQETFTAVARIFVLSSSDISVLGKFNDSGKIASWAAEYMAALTERGYINGDHEGNSKPESYISREEFAQFMHNAIRTYITEPGTYTADFDGIVVVRVGDVFLKDLKITDDLIIGDGVGKDNITINGVTIEKRLLARGGTIKVSNSTLGEFVVVNNVNGTTYFKNYRNDAFFKGIVENTAAQFLTHASSGVGSTPSSDTVYTLTFKVDGVVYDTVIVTNGIPDHSVSDPQKDYYTFAGWYDASGNLVTDFGAVTATQDLTAHFTAITYGVAFTGSPSLEWKDSYIPITSFTVEEIETKELPPSGKVKAPLGYIFEYWMINGTRVNSLTEIKDGGYLTPTEATSLTIEAYYSLKEYRVEYSNVTWKDGCAPTVFTYNIENVSSFELPAGSNVVAPSGEEFKYWKNEATGERVDSLTIDEDTEDVITLTPVFGPIPSDPVSVTFYRIYSNNPVFRIGDPLSIERGTTVAEGAFPNADDYVREGYVENANVASVYEGDEWTHEIVPEFWYVKDGVMTVFDETVEVTEDTNVYLLSKRLSLMLTFEQDGSTQALQVSADYNKDTRMVNSVKDIIAKSGRQQLEDALELNMIPNYDEMVSRVVDKMVSAGVIELDGDKKNIQIIEVPFKISTFVKEEIANNMIKQYLRDVVKNPAELDKIISLIDVSEFAGQLGIDTVIANMTDAEIASLITSADYKDDILDFVLADLKKDDSKMMDFVIDYVIGDNDFREDLIAQIVAELKDKTKTSTLKTKALNYIETQTKDSASAFYDKFVAMIKADLKSENSVVIDAVVSYLRTNLKANTDDGKALRKEILTSSLLSSFLADDKMKAEIINVALTDDFINKALNNVDYREILVEAIMADDDFVNLLLASTEFHDYIIDQLHPVEGDAAAHPLAKDLEDLIADETSEFRKYVLDLVKESTAFVNLFESHPELKTVVSAEIKWSDFVSDESDLLKFVFKQDDVSGTYTFISRDDIETEIAKEYNALSEAQKLVLFGTAADYGLLSEVQKQTVRDEFYEDATVKNNVLDAARSKFDSYKSDMVDKITSGKAGEIEDQTVIKLIDKLLADYITKYIEKDDLHADKAISDSIAGVIEEILFDFISKLILGEDIENEELEDELSNMLTHVEDIKHQFVKDPTPDIVENLKKIVKDYRDTHTDNIKKVISDNYTKLTEKITGMIDPDDSNSVYSEIESSLISVADIIDASLIKDYIKGIADNYLENLIKKYITIITVDDLNTYIASFLTVEANETAVKAELNNFILDDNQKETIREFAKTYINDPVNETEIEENVSSFIDGIGEEFVNQNREVITDALKSIDITAFVDEQFIKDYVAGLTDDEKTVFADEIIAALQNNNDYKTFMSQLFNSDYIVVDKSNASMLTVISTSIRKLTFDSIIDYIDNSIIDKLKGTIGEDYIKPLYNEMLKDYCDGFDAAINRVENNSEADYTETYTTSLKLRLNIFDIYEKLYDKVAPKVIEKLENANIYYNDNKYLKFLVEQDFLSYLVDGDETLASGDFTGYSLKGVMDYYDYLAMLLIVGDDAITWYGDNQNLTEQQFEVLYDAMFDKVFAVHEKMNDILIAFKDEGTLPTQIQGAIDAVEQLNNLMLKIENKSRGFIEKYLGSNLNVKFEDESIAEEDKVVKFIDFLVGKDNPCVNIDSIYATINEYDENIQAKLKELIESDKFKQAIEKFEATSFGEMFSGKGQLGTIGDKIDELKNNGRIESALDSVYDFFYIVANEGLDAFKVPATEVTEIDIYKVKIGKVTITVKRLYE